VTTAFTVESITPWTSPQTATPTQINVAFWVKGDGCHTGCNRHDKQDPGPKPVIEPAHQQPTQAVDHHRQGEQQRHLRGREQMLCLGMEGQQWERGNPQ